MEVLAWSYKCAASGTFPTCRHNGTPWLPSDSWRKKRASKPLGCRSVLCEVRADWAFMAQVFKFPAHNTKRGCCWLCPVTPENLRDFSLSAPWRTERMSHWGLLQRWHEWEVRPSPLFAAPFLTSQCFGVDWLHCVDQGVAADYLGNLLWHVLPQFPGANRREKVSALYKRIQTYYRQHRTDSCYQDMTELMIKQPKKSPKLRGKAAEVRGLVPFGLQLAQELVVGTDTQSVTIRSCALHLSKAYDCLSAATFNPDHLETHVRQFCLLYVALEAATPNPKLWRVKPKLHLFAELGMARNRPALQWTYRDEDFGGTAAKTARRRGGSHSVRATGMNFLSKFFSKNRMPDLRRM